MARTIWIGDVHGCLRELVDLLDTLGPTAGDRVVFVGDLVARGPDTLGVLRLVRELGALSTRGNHEHRMLLARKAQLERTRPPHLGPSHQKLLTELEDEDWAQLEALPLSLDFPEHGVRVVHAGVQPGVPFEDQQAWTLLHVRSLTAGGAASDKFQLMSWAEHYHEAPHIVFGHNAQAGLGLYESATGLDSACVYGGSLSALVLEGGMAPPPVAMRREVIVSQRARGRYVGYGPRTGEGE